MARDAVIRRAALPIVGAALLAGPLGCLAAIHEERSYGVPRPSAAAVAETSEERRTAAPLLRAAANGSKIEVTLVEPTECRQMVLTRDMVREVDVRRSFVDPRAQQWDLALALLVGAGAGLMAYDENGPWACSGGCAGQVGAAAGGVEWPLIALAAAPMALVAYNALRVQDSRRIEPAAPEQAAGPWSVCATRPLAHEEVSVSVGERDVRATTGADGVAAVDLSAWAPASPYAEAIVRHAGATDVVVTLGDIPSTR